MDLIEKALHFATVAHQGQTRRGNSQIPYITHCIGVKNLLMEVGVVDPETLSAALLHDTLEDCNVKGTDLYDQFGETVTDLVMDLTDDQEMSRDERHRQQAQRMEYISEKAAMIKMADRIYNLKDFTTEIPTIARDGAIDRVKSYAKYAHTLADAIHQRAPQITESLVVPWDKLYTQLEDAILELEIGIAKQESFGFLQ